jgi:hypothetical protein
LHSSVKSTSANTRSRNQTAVRLWFPLQTLQTSHRQLFFRCSRIFPTNFPVARGSRIFPPVAVARGSFRRSLSGRLNKSSLPRLILPDPSVQFYPDCFTLVTITIPAQDMISSNSVSARVSASYSKTIELLASLGPHSADFFHCLPFHRSETNIQSIFPTSNLNSERVWFPSHTTSSCPITVSPCGPCRLHIVSCSSKLASIYPSKIPQFKTNFHTSFVSV